MRGPPDSGRGSAQLTTGADPTALDIARRDTGSKGSTEGGSAPAGVAVWRCARCGWDTTNLGIAGCEICDCGFGHVTVRLAQTPREPRISVTHPCGTANTEPHRTEPRTTPQHGVCDHCGGAFEIKRRGGRFCGDTCRRAAHRRRRQLATLARLNAAVGIAPSDVKRWAST